MKVLFISQPARAFGEINVVSPLAESIMARGGEAQFLLSPLAARVVRQKYPDRTFEMTENRDDNQVVFWRIVKKFRPDLIIFSALHELLHPNRVIDCPLIDWYWLRDVRYLDTTFIFIDFIIHVPGIQNVFECWDCSSKLGRPSLRAFLKRLWVILPCPLNEPSTVNGRCGIPYRTMELPLTQDPAERANMRHRFLGDRLDSEGILIVRGSSNWQGMLAEEYGIPLYEYLGRVLSVYLDGLPKPVTLVSVSDQHQLQVPLNSNIRVSNFKNLPPSEYEQLLLASDLVLTDNEIGYSLARVVGNVPGVVLVNSYTVEELLDREKPENLLRSLLIEMEQRRPGSIYPFHVFPLRAEPQELIHASQNGDSNYFLPQSMRLGRMMSSPYYRVEIFGGPRTRTMFEWLLIDPSSRARLARDEAAYLARLNEIDDGPSVLTRILESSRLYGQTVL